MSLGSKYDAIIDFHMLEQLYNNYFDLYKKIQHVKNEEKKGVTINSLK